MSNPGHAYRCRSCKAPVRMPGLCFRCWQLEHSYTEQENERRRRRDAEEQEQDAPAPDGPKPLEPGEEVPDGLPF